MFTRLRNLAAAWLPDFALGPLGATGARFETTPKEGVGMKRNVLGRSSQVIVVPPTIASAAVHVIE